VSFLGAAGPLLTRPAPHQGSWADSPGQVLVTLFEQPPYTLWNVRDLARHVGLQPVTSSQFRFEAYPGYKHARTLGNIHGKETESNVEAAVADDEDERHDGERKRAGNWRGEERKARIYIFENPSEDVDRTAKGSRAKRKAEEDSSDDE
jgi:25S rRNA (uracil2634-N3)-methyltransferase